MPKDDKDLVDESTQMPEGPEDEETNDDAEAEALAEIARIDAELGADAEEGDGEDETEDEVAEEAEAGVTDSASSEVEQTGDGSEAPAPALPVFQESGFSFPEFVEGQDWDDWNDRRTAALVEHQTQQAMHKMMFANTALMSVQTKIPEGLREPIMKQVAEHMPTLMMQPNLIEGFVAQLVGNAVMQGKGLAAPKVVAPTPVKSERTTAPPQSAKEREGYSSFLKTFGLTEKDMSFKEYAQTKKEGR